MKDTLRILNLGAGVQSTVIALMIHRGELPPIDCAIFADTQEESKATYAHLQWLTREVSESFPVHVVTRGKLGTELQHGRNSKGGSSAMIPAFTRSENATSADGIIPRQCTSDYKISPINKFIRQKVLGLKPGQSRPRNVLVTQIFGLSYDEPGRVSRVRASIIDLGFEPAFPLFERAMTRRECVKWLEEYPVPHPVPRSACVFCQYKSNKEWETLKETDTEGWARAIQIDGAIRGSGTARRNLKSKPYVHRSCVPLAQADLRDVDKRTGQSTFDFGAECQGMCGV